MGRSNAAPVREATLLFATLVAVFVFVDRCRFDEFVFHQAVVELFAGNARGFGGARIVKKRGRARHELPRASGGQYNVGELALRSFGFDAHFSHSLQTMPEVVLPGRDGVPSYNVMPAKSIVLRDQRTPRLHSLHNNRSIYRKPQSRHAPGPSGERFPHRNPARGCAAGARVPGETGAK